MRHPVPITLFLTILIAVFFLSPTEGTANCNLDDTTISLSMINKPLKDIIKDIEKQTQFTIIIDDPKTLDEKKSIILNEAPLNQSLRRLLKDINYSTICDNEQKILTLVFLDKKSISPSSPAHNNSAQANVSEPEAFNMDAIASAFEDYNNIDKQIDLGPQEKTSMDGVTESFERYNNTDKQIDLGPQEKTSMDGLTTAFEEYSSSGGKINQVEEQQDVTSMDGVTAAFKNYNNRDSRKVSTEQQQEATSMGGVDAAFEEYRSL